MDQHRMDNLNLYDECVVIAQKLEEFPQDSVEEEIG